MRHYYVKLIVKQIHSGCFSCCVNKCTVYDPNIGGFKVIINKIIKRMNKNCITFALYTHNILLLDSYVSEFQERDHASKRAPSSTYVPPVLQAVRSCLCAPPSLPFQFWAQRVKSRMTCTAGHECKNIMTHSLFIKTPERDCIVHCCSP